MPSSIFSSSPPMRPLETPGQAAASCSRCHKRKKRCDRSLPQCDSCRRAFVTCSFFCDDSQVASYPISYVRALENRIQELEEALASLQHTTAPTQDDGSSSRLGLMAGRTTAGSETTDPEQNLQHVQPSRFQDGGWDDLAMLWDQTAFCSLPFPPQTLEEQLKQLSLEATAERYLGSSSGISLARLTQAILRQRDNLDSILSNEPETTIGHPTPGSPSMPPNYHMFDDISASMTRALIRGDNSSPVDAEETRNRVADLKSPNHVPHFNKLVDYYFAHSHTLYPIIDQEDFLSGLEMIDKEPANPVQSSLCLFRTWMVLAIGSTARSSISLEADPEASIYYEKALTYFEDAFGIGHMAALETIMLQISYSFFNHSGPNTWQLVGLAARIALGVGLQSSSTYEGLPFDIIQKRKRLFFSLYMMDRVVSTPLGRPFAIHDDDISISVFGPLKLKLIGEPPYHVPGTFGHGHPSPYTGPKITSKITRLVYSNPEAVHLTLDEREEIIYKLHEELIQWRRGMPFPLPIAEAQVPHFTSTWYDLSYYTQLTILYRPSSLFPILDQRRMRILAEAASSSILHTWSMHSQRTYSYNWLNLLTLYTSTISLIYSVTTQADGISKVLGETKAADDIRRSVQIFETLESRAPLAQKIKGVLTNIVRRCLDFDPKSGQTYEHGPVDLPSRFV